MHGMRAGDKASFVTDAMKKALFIVFLAIGSTAAHAGPPLLDTATFGCTKAHSDAARLICSDPELADDDRRMAEMYSLARAAAMDKDAFKLAEHDAWNDRERNCHDKDCLVKWYTDQISQLTYIANTGLVDY
ncbi:hypothetical protein LMG29739_00527 [Paraburkholderia solisilvae]|uniref:Lysozyme inhibitor LprI N-terminal domain-containing protein n=2 Tax=Paraburkholderia solisilvae TaxID=624376 RepID=A0A6J5D1U6_9BURK|nr:hypothetical protein LMG29739_00527 [Paraburkholderia solisilvae]